jgi:hypothetical protein
MPGKITGILAGNRTLGHRNYAPGHPREDRSSLLPCLCSGSWNRFWFRRIVFASPEVEPLVTGSFGSDGFSWRVHSLDLSLTLCISSLPLSVSFLPQSFDVSLLVSSLSRSLPLISINLTVSHSLARFLCISWLEEGKGRTTKKKKGEERTKEEACDFQRCEGAFYKCESNECRRWRAG